MGQRRLRAEMGQQARLYAQEHFGLKSIAIKERNLFQKTLTRS